MGNGHTSDDSFSLAYALTLKDRDAADGLVRKFEGFRSTAGRTGDRATVSLRGRQAAMSLDQDGLTCIIRITDVTYLEEVTGFITTNQRNITSWRTEDPEKERGRLEPTVRVGELEAQLRTVTGSLRDATQLTEGLQRDYGALQERYATLEGQVDTLERARGTVRERIEALETENTQIGVRVRSLEASLLDADPFNTSVKEFATLEEKWTRVKALIGKRELEDVIAIARAGSEAYLQAQLPNYADIESLGGRQAIIAAKGTDFESTETYAAVTTEHREARDVLEYAADILLHVDPTDGSLKNPETAPAHFRRIPVLLRRSLFPTIQGSVPQAEAVVARVEQLKLEHQRRQALAQSIEEKEAEYRVIADIPQRIEEVFGQERNATLEVKLLGQEGGNLVFEGRLPVRREGKETELARTLQVCMAATITDKNNFPGLSFTEEDDSLVRYRFTLPQREDQDPLAVTHTLAQRMTVLLGETDFGLAQGKIRVVYTGIIGELPNYADIESRVERKVQAPVVASEAEEDTTDEPTTSKRWGVIRSTGPEVLDYKRFLEMQEREALLLGIYLPTVEEVHLSQKTAVQEATQLNHLGVREVVLAITNAGLVRSKKIAPHIRERLQKYFGVSIPEDQRGRDRYAYRVNHWFESLVDQGFLQRAEPFPQADLCYQAAEKLIQRDLTGYSPEDQRVLYTFSSVIPLGMHTAVQAVEYERRKEERVCAGESFTSGAARVPILVRAAQVIDHYTILTLLKDNPKNQRELHRNLREKLPGIRMNYVGSSIGRLRAARIEDRLEERFEVFHR